MARTELDTGSEDILAHEEDGVVVITLNSVPRMPKTFADDMT